MLLSFENCVSPVSTLTDVEAVKTFDFLSCRSTMWVFRLLMYLIKASRCFESHISPLPCSCLQLLCEPWHLRSPSFLISVSSWSAPVTVHWTLVFSFLTIADSTTCEFCSNFSARLRSSCSLCTAILTMVRLFALSSYFLSSASCIRTSSTILRHASRCSLLAASPLVLALQHLQSGVHIS